MGEKLTLFRPTFNRSIQVEARPERLTTDPGAVLLREIMERLGIVSWLAQRITDPRNPDLVTHPTAELLYTAILLPAQGWQDRADADLLRYDPALCLSVSTRKGASPLSPAGGGPSAGRRPQGLSSQPTLSRFVGWLATPGEPASVEGGPGGVRPPPTVGPGPGAAPKADHGRGFPAGGGTREPTRFPIPRLLQGPHLPSHRGLSR